MKHLEESNSNVADGEEEGPKREEFVAPPPQPTDLENFPFDNHQAHEAAQGPTVPIISVTEADSDDNPQKDDQERSESPRPEVVTPKPEVLDDTMVSPTVVIIEPGRDDRRRDELYCQISQQDSLDHNLPVAAYGNQSLRSQKMEGLKTQKAFDEPPRISHHVIYEESSDSEGHIRSTEGHGRNVKRVARKTRASHARAHILHGMRIDSIEDHEGSSSPPYDDTRASESANSLNDFYLEYVKQNIFLFSVTFNLFIII